MDRSRYPAGWEKMSRILRRKYPCCEQCGVPNGTPLPTRPGKRPAKVVLTVAHIGAPLPTGDGWKAGDQHDKHDVRRENLRVWCQRCHFTYDLADHIAHARITRLRKKGKLAVQIYAVT